MKELKKDEYIQKGSTLLLRAVVLAMGLAALALCIFVLPNIFREWPTEYPDAAAVRYLLLAGCMVSALSFFGALVQTLNLLRYLDKDLAFSAWSVRALEKIKYCALIMFGAHILVLPAVYIVADGEDAPGLVIIGLVFVGAPLVIAVFAAVLARLLQRAISIKKENDLTV